MNSRMSRPVNPPLGDPRMTGVWQRSAPSVSASTPSRKSKNAPAIQGGGSIDGSWDTGYGPSNLVSISNGGFYINPNTNAQNCQPFLGDPAVNGDLQQRISDLRFRSLDDYLENCAQIPQFAMVHKLVFLSYTRHNVSVPDGSRWKSLVSQY
jgi:hypothetical protein